MFIQVFQTRVGKRKELLHYEKTKLNQPNIQKQQQKKPKPKTKNPNTPPHPPLQNNPQTNNKTTLKASWFEIQTKYTT